MRSDVDEDALDRFAPQHRGLHRGAQADGEIRIDLFVDGNVECFSQKVAHQRNARRSTDEAYSRQTRLADVRVGQGPACQRDRGVEPGSDHFFEIAPRDFELEVHRVAGRRGEKLFANRHPRLGGQRYFGLLGDAP